jgi:hypothetical protein
MLKMSNTVTVNQVSLEVVMEDRNLVSTLSGSNLIELFAELDYEMAEGCEYQSKDLYQVQVLVKNELLKRLGEPQEEPAYKWYME